jgi:hypothetical protein
VQSATLWSLQLNIKDFVELYIGMVIHRVQNMDDCFTKRGRLYRERGSGGTTGSFSFTRIKKRASWRPRQGDGALSFTMWNHGGSFRPAEVHLFFLWHALGLGLNS